jgi:hypothetical protein
VTDEYYAEVYLRGCGELVQRDVQVDDSDPEFVVLVIRAYKPGA